MVLLDELPPEILELIAHTRPDIGRLIALCIRSFAQYIRKHYRLPDDVWTWYKRTLSLRCPINDNCCIHITTVIYPISTIKSIDHDPRLVVVRYPTPPPLIAKELGLTPVTGYLIHSFDDQPAITHAINHPNTEPLDYDCYYEKGSIICSVKNLRIFKAYRYSKEIELVQDKHASPITNRISCSEKSPHLYFNLATLPWIWCEPSPQSIASFAQHKSWQHIPIDLPEKTWVKLGWVHRDHGPTFATHNGNEIGIHCRPKNNQKQSRCVCM